MNAATEGARHELVWEADTLAAIVTPLCQHAPFVDRTLIDIERAGGRTDNLQTQIALKTTVAEQTKALRLDSLMLVTAEGVILAASDKKRIGTRDRSLAARLKTAAGVPQLIQNGREATMQVHCTRSQRAGQARVGGRASSRADIKTCWQSL